MYGSYFIISGKTFFLRKVMSKKKVSIIILI